MTKKMMRRGLDSELEEKTVQDLFRHVDMVTDVMGTNSRVNQVLHDDVLIMMGQYPPPCYDTAAYEDFYKRFIDVRNRLKTWSLINEEIEYYPVEDAYAKLCFHLRSRLLAQEVISEVSRALQ